MQHYLDSVLDSAGNAIVGATITIKDHTTGAFIPVYSDYAGTVLINTVITDSSGQFSFYMQPARCDLGIYLSGVLLHTVSDVFIGSGADVATLGNPLPVAYGGTGVSSSTGIGAVVLSQSPTLITPILGLVAAGDLTACTGVASALTAGNVTTNANLTGAVTSIGNATSLGSFTSANLAAALTDETGTGAAVFANTPTLVTPILGTPTSGTLTNCTGVASALTAGNVTTNANLTGVVTSTGNATSLGSFTSANLAAALTDETGTGAAVFANTPTLVTPNIGAATGASLAATGNVYAANGIGYTTGAGGAVTQITSRSTGVTLSKATGNITLFTDTIAANTSQSFTLTNTVIGANDMLVIQHISGGTLGLYDVTATPAAGSALITVRNNTASITPSEAPVLKFALIKCAVT